MVRDCPKCGENAYATVGKFRDMTSICRACRYYHISIDNIDGYDLDFEYTDRGMELNTDYEHRPPNPMADGVIDEVEVVRCAGCEASVFNIASLVGDVWACECTVHRRTKRRGMPDHWTLESYDNTVGKKE